MKYLFVILMIVFIALPSSVFAEGNAVTNNIYNSTIQQYFLLNCTTVECASFWQQIMQTGNQNSTPLNPTPLMTPVIQVVPAVPFEQTVEPVNPELTAEPPSTIEPPAPVDPAVPVVDVVETHCNASPLIQAPLPISTPPPTVVPPPVVEPTIDPTPMSVVAPTPVVEPTVNQPSTPIVELVVDPTLPTTLTSIVEITASPGVPGSVLISEIVAVPLAGEKEWVELFNNTTQPIDLTKWMLEEGGGKKTELFGVIEPAGYLVFDKSYLNNDGDAVILLDPASTIIDEVAYGNWENSLAPAAKQGDSIILNGDQYEETNTVTPAEENIPMPPVVVATSPVVETPMLASPLPTPVQATLPLVTPVIVPEIVVPVPSVQPPVPITVFPPQIRINEFLPNPTVGGVEWIELYNYGASDVDLNGWSLDDMPDGSTPYKIKSSLIIPANGFLQLNATETKLALNNGGDQVRLINPAGEVVDLFEYTQSKSNVSFSYFPDGWLETSVPTPGATNAKEELQAAAVNSVVATASAKSTTKKTTKKVASIATVDIANVLTLPLKTSVKLDGQVIVVPNTLGNKLMYINGLQIYNSTASWPTLQLGDDVVIQGTVSESRGERRLLVKKNTDIVVLSNDTPVEPLSISSIDLGNDDVGQLVSFTGKLLDRKGSNLILSDESGEVTVQINANTSIKAIDYTIGSNLTVTGVVTRNVNDLRIVPRGKEDISFIQDVAPVSMAGIVPATGGSSSRVMIILSCLAMALLAVNLYFFWQKKDELAKFFSSIRQVISRSVGKSQS